MRIIQPCKPLVPDFSSMIEIPINTAIENEIPINTAIENPISNASRHQPGALVSIPNAIPGFSVWTMLKKFGMTDSVSQAEKCALMIDLVMRSSRKTAAAMAKGMKR